ncbi:MAG: hypothetical protein ACREL5_03870 [Gemmatimonadales bacterium]
MLLLLPVLIAASNPAPSPRSGAEVIRAAHRMYRGKCFRTAHYVQRTLLSLEQRLETWYVTVKQPGLMRVDVAPGITGRAFIYRNDSTYEFGRGQLRGQSQGILPLYTLLRDLRCGPPDQVIAALQRYGFDLSKVHETTWDHQPILVVGALAGDSTSNQFWLQKSHYLLVRLIENNGSDPRRPLDARIGAYRQAGGDWLEQSVRLYLGGVLTTAEDYTDIVINPALESDVFEPLPYHLPKWVGAAPDRFGRVPNAIPRPPP